MPLDIGWLLFRGVPGFLMVLWWLIAAVGGIALLIDWILEVTRGG